MAQHAHFYTIFMLQLLLLVPVVLSLSTPSRICDPARSNHQYTGFRLDKQVTVQRNMVKSFQSHLSLCKDGYLINDYYIEETDLASGIPWNQTLCNTLSCYKVARSKAYAPRPISLFPPGNIVGGLFELRSKDSDPSDDAMYLPIERLIADPIHNQWVEVNTKSDTKVFHFALLHTPDITDRKYESHKDDWFQHVSANEKYQYSYESKNRILNSFGVAYEQVKSIITSSSKKIRDLNNLVSDLKPVRKAIKSINVPKNDNIILTILKDTFDTLLKKRLHKSKLDFDVLAALSYTLPHDQFDQLLKTLNGIYDKISFSEEKFTYKLETETEDDIN